MIIDACSNPYILKVIYFVKELLKIVYFLVPMILILMVSLDIAKNIMAKDTEAMHKNVKIAIKRVLLAVFLFLIYTIVSFFMNLLNDIGIESSWLTCYNKATLEEISKAQDEYDSQKVEDTYDDVPTPDFSK